MFETLKQDVAAVLARDPAIHSKAEVFFCYPGFRAVRRHRRAHRAYQKGHFFWARLISARTKRLTGIDIHPGAVIGQGLFIDHGSGVVIGETAVLGNNVTLYQGVTLGGTGKDTGKRQNDRHDFLRKRLPVRRNAHKYNDQCRADILNDRRRPRIRPLDCLKVRILAQHNASKRIDQKIYRCLFIFPDRKCPFRILGQEKRQQQKP